MNTQQGDFSQGRVKNLIFSLAGPMIVAQLVGVLYNVVDRMFIGHIAEKGSFALTGLGVVFPLVALFNAFANWAGQGGSIIFAIQRGKGDDDYATNAMGNAFFLLIIMSLGLIAMVLMAETKLMYMFGASEETLPYALAYLRIYLIGTPFQLFSLGMNPFINAQGFPKTAMFSVLIGAVVNLILDPLLIFVLDMGVQGAALATIIAQFASAIWVISFLFGKKTHMPIKLKNIMPRLNVILEILKIGFANFCFQLTNSITQAVSNSVLLSYGGNLQVAVMTVLISVRQIFYMTTDGLTNAAKPVLSFNFGAGKRDRVFESIRIMLIGCFFVTALATVLVFVFPVAIMRIFTSDNNLIELAIPNMKIFFVAFVFMALQTTGQSTFTALGMARHATFFSLFRKAILLLPLTLLLPQIPWLNVKGVYVAEALSQIIGGTACFVTMIYTLKKRLKNI